jgi:small subunit ribosomal protein S20
LKLYEEALLPQGELALRSLMGQYESGKATFQSVLDALNSRLKDRQGRLDILSRPQIMTLDNQTAIINVGQEIQIVTSSNVTATGVVQTNIERKNIGVIMQVGDYSELLKKLGVKFISIHEGEFKDAGAPWRALTATETQVIIAPRFRPTKINLKIEPSVQAWAAVKKILDDKSGLRGTLKVIRAAVDTNDVDTVKEQVQEAVSLVDRMVSKGVIHRNAAARYKSRLSNRVAKSAAKAA